MKRSFLFFVALFLGGVLNAQDFRQRLDVGDGALFRDLHRLPGGQMIAVGELTGTSVLTGWIVFLEADGTVIWSQAAVSTGQASSFRRILPDTDSTFLVGGTLYVDPVRGLDLLLFRMNHKGQVLWARNFHADQVDEFWDMAVNAKGTYLAGSTLDPATSFDILIAHIDENGNLAQSRQFGAAGLEYPASIRLAGPTALYVSGTTTSYVMPGSPNNAFLMKVNADLTQNWIRVIGDNTQHSVESMEMDTSGYPVLALHDAGGGIFGNVLCRFDPNGALDWSRAYTTGYLRTMTRGPGGRIHVADDQTVAVVGANGAITASWFLQPDGNFISSALQAGPQGQLLLAGWNVNTENEPALHVIQNPMISGCGVFEANILHQPHDPVVIPQLINEKPAGQLDTFFLVLAPVDAMPMIDCIATSMDDEKQPEQALAVYPNPAHGRVTVQLPLQEAGRLTWYAPDGRVWAVRDLGPEAAVVEEDLTGFPTGTGILEFRAGERRWTTPVIRIE